MSKQIKLSNIPDLSSEELNKVAINIADKLIAEEVGLNWGDVPTEVDINSFLKEGMSSDEFKVAINEAVEAKLVTYNKETGLFESEKAVAEQMIKEGLNVDKVKALIEKRGARDVAKVLIDLALGKMLGGLGSSDLADTATFANGLDEVEALLNDGYYEDAYSAAKDTATMMIDDEGFGGMFDEGKESIEEKEEELIPGFKFSDGTFIEQGEGADEKAIAYAKKLGYEDLQASYDDEGHIWSEWPADEVNEDVVTEAVSGEKVTKAAQRGSGKDSKDYLKDATKKVADYNKPDGDQEYEAVKYKQSSEEEEFVEDIEYGFGQQDLRYDNEPDEKFKDRAKKAIEGDSTMGNKVYTGDENGNTDEFWNSSDSELGKRIVKNAERKAKKIDAATPNLISMGDDIEIQKGPFKGKKTAFGESSIVKLTTKTKIGGLEKAKSIIPEAEKKDGNIIVMTDGNESYKFKWNGDTSQADVMEVKNETKLDESLSRINDLMGFKADSNAKSVNDGFGSIMENARKLEESEVVSEMDDMEEMKMDEAEIEDPQTKASISEFYELQNKVKALTKELKEAKGEFGKFGELVTPLLNSMQTMDDRLAETEGYVIKVKKFAHDRETASYKDAFNLALSKVNEATQNVLKSALEESKKTTKIAHAFEIKQESAKDRFKEMLNSVVSGVKEFLTIFKSYDAEIDQANDELAGLVSSDK